MNSELFVDILTLRVGEKNVLRDCCIYKVINTGFYMVTAWLC